MVKKLLSVIIISVVALAPLQIFTLTASADTGLVYVNPNGQTPVLTAAGDITSYNVIGSTIAAVTTDGSVYTQDGIVEGLSNVKQAYIATAPDQGFVIKNDGTVWSWGKGDTLGRINDPGGTGTNQYDSIPQQIIGLPVITQLAVSNSHVLALDVNGNVWSWGEDNTGQLGTDCGSKGEGDLCLLTRIMPKQVPGVTNIRSISSGFTGSVAVTNDNTLIFWGYVCGIEAGWPYVLIPTVYPGTSNVKQAIADECGVMYISNDGNVYNWGKPGQNQTDPGQITDITDAVSLRSNGFYNRAIMTSTGEIYSNNEISNSLDDLGSYATSVTYAAYIPNPGDYIHPGGIIVGSSAVKPMDSNAPVLSSMTWTNNPKSLTQTAILSVPVSDDASGVARGEYFIGDTDPGQGNGATMALSNVQNGGLNTDLTTTFGTGFQPGVYKISVRAQDKAGNWSAPVSDYLVVYDSTTGLKFTGKNKKDLVPSLANGDVLPGLVSAGQTDAANYGFTAQFKNGALDSHNDFQFSYSTGTSCGKKTASNCHSFSLNASSFAWLVFDQTKNSRGQFQGTANVTVDGVVTTNIFTLQGVDGDKLTPTLNDSIVLKVYAPGTSPANSAPIYQATGSMPKGNSVTIQ